MPLSAEALDEFNWWMERKDMTLGRKKAAAVRHAQLAEAHAEQLGAGAFRAALTDFLLEARRTLQVVKVAALTHAAVGFMKLSAHPIEELDAGEEQTKESDQLIALAKRCRDEAKVQLGAVTG